MLTQSKVAAKESLVAETMRSPHLSVFFSEAHLSAAASISRSRVFRISQRRTRPRAHGRKNEQGRENFKNRGKRKPGEYIRW